MVFYVNYAALPVSLMSDEEDIVRKYLDLHAVSDILKRIANLRLMNDLGTDLFLSDNQLHCGTCSRCPSLGLITCGGFIH